MPLSGAKLRPDGLAPFDREDLTSLRALLVSDLGIDYHGYLRSVVTDAVCATPDTF
jgi:hypothetical protein